MATTTVPADVATVARRCARGSEQRSFVDLLLAGQAPHPLSYGLRGSAQRYSARYAASTVSLVERLRAAGLTIEHTPGPRGGFHSSTYRLVI